MSLAKPMMNSCQVGKVMSVGKNVRDVKIGEIALFHHGVEDGNERFLGTDDEGEYRVVKEAALSGELFGVIKTPKKGWSHIQPKRDYVLAEPPENYFEMTTKGIFQIPISAVNPRDDNAKKLKLKVGDWIVCDRYGAYSIVVERKEFWFIHLEDIIAVNEGMHQITVPHKFVSEYLKAASTDKKIVFS